MASKTILTDILVDGNLSVSGSSIFTSTQTDVANSEGVVIDTSLNDGLPDSKVNPNVDGEYSEYQFTADNLDLFVGFTIKIVMSGTNEAYTAKFKDLRVIALA